MLYATFIGTAVKTNMGWHVNTVIAAHPNLETQALQLITRISSIMFGKTLLTVIMISTFIRLFCLLRLNRTGLLFVPDKVNLYQNFPNPFNPSTNISFHLPSTALVSLKIYDLLGREITDLVSEKMEAGDDSVVWDAFGISGGIYFYRLQAGNFITTKMLLFLK